jgi:hypothetical protein
MDVPSNRLNADYTASEYATVHEHTNNRKACDSRRRRMADETPLSEFTLFPQLPVEIRLEIWRITCSFLVYWICGSYPSLVGHGRTAVQFGHTHLYLRV